MLMAGEVLGEGGSAQIIECPGGRLIKLFFDRFPKSAIEHELSITNQIGQLGIPVPRMERIVHYRGRLGIIYDKVKGPNFLEWAMRLRIPVPEMSSHFVQLHRQVHRAGTIEIPELKDRLRVEIGRCARLPADYRAQALRLLEELPGGDIICHMDFHPRNVIISDYGPVILDWAKVARGDYLADVAMTSIILKIGAMLRQTPVEELDDAEPLVARFLVEYTDDYLRLCGRRIEDLRNWEMVLAAARLSDCIPEERESLRQLVSSYFGKSDKAYSDDAACACQEDRRSS